MTQNWFLSILVSLIVYTIDAQSPIVPAPSKFELRSGAFEVTAAFTIQDNKSLKFANNQLVEYFSNYFDLAVKLVPSNGKLVFKPIQNKGVDFYSIEVSDSIIICYSSEASSFYAVNSLLQLVVFDGEKLQIPHCYIEDAPRFGWRGLHLDVSRHFFTVDEVKRYIDLMAFYKFNTFHWHLTDDQGWRIEIKKYPELTRVGARRDSTLIGHYNDVPWKFDRTPTSGFYTQAEIQDVVAYAKSKYIEIVPEIEMPGHARAALAAYPMLGCSGTFQPVPGTWGVFDDIFCSKPETIQFLKDVLSEVVALFPSKYIHIGGDEAPKNRWKACEKCQRQKSIHGLKDEHELQRYFVTQMDQFLASKGRTLIGWDEILEGGLSPNAAVMSWRGEAGGVDAATQRHQVVMSPTEFCYFDYYQSSHSAEPLAIGGYLPLEKVYSYSPIPAKLNADLRPFILGAQANLWTEYIADFSGVEYMTYPRALALAQVLWCNDKPSYETFETVLINHQLPILKRMGVAFSYSFLYPEMQVSPTNKGLKVVFKSARGDEKYNLIIRETIGEKEVHAQREISVYDTLFFERASEDHLFHFELSPINTYEFMHSPFDLKVHAGVGLPVTYLTQPNSKYATNGNLTLVDGIIGKHPWKGDEWLGFDTDTIVFMVDLKQHQFVKDVRLGFLEANGSWIYLPKAVEFSFSADQQTWTKLKKMPVSEDFVQPVNVNIRYLKVTVIAMSEIPAGFSGAGNVPWTFMDELEIIH
ncbi:MAG: beta-N-acetylhexosaminidase [Crocinitomicaceae bacterium]|nr:MAG: beta-N-acetylhexosaminidase [Crocinitomicaceae bacterium]